LRRFGIRTLAKTTGVDPQLVLPDGSSESIRRWAPANILEQLQVIRRADKLQVDAVVIECMALDPVLQFVSEKQLIQSTIGVITNVRPDHFEVMGENLVQIASALAQTIPVRGTLITADATYFPLFSALAHSVQSDSILADGGQVHMAQPLEDSPVFNEHIAIARQVCLRLGLDPSVVDSSLIDPCSSLENSAVLTRSIDSRKIFFIDAFSANDIDSTRIIQDWSSARTHCPKPWVALYNHRDDRPLRMRSFAEFLAAASCYDGIAVVGESLGLATRYFRRALPGKRLMPIRNTSPELLLAELFRQFSCHEFTIIGMGNEKGTGQRVSRFFRSVGQHESA
jgi:poly-gamma-glutamate synthase PgsB/CapB